MLLLCHLPSPCCTPVFGQGTFNAQSSDIVVLLFVKQSCGLRNWMRLDRTLSAENLCCSERKCECPA